MRSLGTWCVAIVALLMFTLGVSGGALAADARTIVSLVDEICLTCGGDLPAIEAFAAARGWRSLTVTELDALPLADPLGYTSGWALADGEDPIFLTVSLPRYTLTPSNITGSRPST